MILWVASDFILYPTYLFHDALSLRVHVSSSWCWYHPTHRSHFYLQLPFTAQQPTQNKWESVIPDKHCVLLAILWIWGLIRPSFLHLSPFLFFFFFCLVIKRHYGCSSQARHRTLSLQGGVFDLTTFLHSTGRKWDGVMMNVVDAYFTLMSSRVTVALPLPRCWVWWCLENWAPSK